MFKDKDANEGVPVEQLYTKGQSKSRGGNYDSAITTYKRPGRAVSVRPLHRAGR